MVRKDDPDWMAYIDAEVRTVCEAKGWGHQIRRKWSARHTPVSDSPIDEYEWKLIPDAQGRLPDAVGRDFDGVYYVLGVDKARGTFVLLHDTSHVGEMGPHWEESTYTEFRSMARGIGVTPGKHEATADLPPKGWLGDHLLRMVDRFGPNSFSIT